MDDARGEIRRRTLDDFSQLNNDVNVSLGFQAECEKFVAQNLAKSPEIVPDTISDRDKKVLEPFHINPSGKTKASRSFEGSDNQRHKNENLIRALNDLRVRMKQSRTKSGRVLPSKA